MRCLANRVRCWAYSDKLLILITHSFIRWLIHSLIPSFLPSFLFLPPFIHSFFRSFVLYLFGHFSVVCTYLKFLGSLESTHNNLTTCLITLMACNKIVFCMLVSTPFSWRALAVVSNESLGSFASSKIILMSTAHFLVSLSIDLLSLTSSACWNCATAWHFGYLDVVIRKADLILVL